MRALLPILLCATTASAQTTYKVPLNYNYNGIVHFGEDGNADNPTGYRSISDRGLDFTAGVPTDELLNKYQIVNIPWYPDIVHLGNRNSVASGAYPFEAAPDGDNLGTIPAWMTAINQSSAQTTTIGSPITLSGRSEATFIYQISDGGGNFDVVFGFESGVEHTAMLTAGDWFGGPYAGTSNVDQAFFELPLSITEGHIDLSAYAGEKLTSFSFQNRSNTNAGYAILAANVTVGLTPRAAIQLPLSYNFNGIVHAFEDGQPDSTNGFRAISDRALNFTAGVPSDPLLGSYSLIDQPGVLDIVHLGNRDTVTAGFWAFQPTANGDPVGTQPAWLSFVNQSGPQTTALATPLLLSSTARAKFLYQMSDGGCYFDVTCSFTGGSYVTKRLGGGDWFGGPYPGTDNIDLATGAGGLSVSEGYIDLSGYAGQSLSHITFSNATNPNVGVAVLGAKLIGVDGVGASYCFGDGSGTGCPCSNSGGAGRGCANSSGPGAILSAIGSASVAADDLVLRGSHMTPNQPGLYFQGNNASGGGSGNPFGDGLRCAGGGVIRLQVRFSDANGSSLTTLGIAAKGGCTAGQLKRYQAWYRDPSGSPCGTQFNLTNGYEITWEL